MSAMPEEFMNSFSITEMEPFLIGFLIVMLVTYLILFVYIAVAYVLQGLGMYTIAKRRGIHNPWLAWIPFANSWLLGSISDQFRYVAYGQVTIRRKWLLATSIGVSVSASVWAVTHIIFTLSGSFRIGVVLYLLTWLAYMAVMVLYTVMNYKSLYDLYKSCNPRRAVLFLMLSIFTVYPMPFFVFACRNKDLGMPPRKQAQPIQELPEVIEEAETAEPAEAAEEEIPVAEDETCTADESDFAEE